MIDAYPEHESTSLLQFLTWHRKSSVSGLSTQCPSNRRRENLWFTRPGKLFSLSSVVDKLFDKSNNGFTHNPSP